MLESLSAKVPDSIGNLFDVGARIARPTVQGLAAPGIAALQIGANAVGKGNGEETLSSLITGKRGGINQMIADQEKAYQASRGPDAGTFDLARTAAEVSNPLAFGALSKLATGGNLLSKLASASGIGILGATATPITEGPYAEGKGNQMLAGAALGPALQAAGSGASSLGKTAYRAIEPMLPNGPADIFKRYAVELAGDGREKLRQALLNAKEYVPGSKPTSAEAMADLAEGTGLAAHQKAIAKAPETSAKFVGRKAEQEGAREAAIGTIAKTDADLEAAIAERAKNAKANYGAIEGQRVDPRSDSQIWNEKVKGAEQRTKDSANADFYPVSGQPKLPGTYSEAFGKNEAHEEAFKNAYQLLKDTVGVEDSSLKTLLNRPSVQAALREAMKSSQERNIYFPSKPGEKFSVENLQRMKVALDDMLNRKGESALDKGVAADVSATRGAFIDWLGSRSPEWKKARLNFAEDSKPINQMQVGNVLKEALVGPKDEERAAQFINATRNAPQTIKKAGSGQTMDSLDQVLTPEQMKVVEAVTQDLVRNQKAQRLAQGTNLTGATNIEQGAQGVRLPNLLSREAMVTNWLLGTIRHGADQKINKLAGEAYLEPKMLAKILEETPQSGRQKLVEAMMRSMRNPGIAASTQQAVQ